MRLSGTKATAIHQYRGLGNQLWDLAGNRPSLDLRFADDKSLVDATTGTNLIDFTRASSGTYVGSDGLIKTATTNLLLRSEEFDNAGWSKTNLTVLPNATSASNGSLTADKLVDNTATAEHLIWQPRTGSNETTVASVYAKAAELSRMKISMSNFATASCGAYFDLTAGTVVATDTGNADYTSPLASIQAVGNGWYRCTLRVTKGAVNTINNFAISLVKSGTSPIYTGDGTSGIYLWGAQLEQSSTVGEYVKTTSTINSAPRFDHDPTTGESLGLLVEESRTNSVTNNTMVGAVAGTPGTLPTGWGTFVSPTGLTRTIVGSGTVNGINYIDVRFNGTPSSTKGITLYLSPATTATLGQAWTSTAWLSLVDGSTSNIAWINLRNFQLNSGAYVRETSNNFVSSISSDLVRRQVITTSFGASANQIQLALSLNATAGGTPIDITLRIGMPQLELGAFATSVIPTTGAAVTRAADVASISGSNFSSWYRQDEGTVFGEGISAGKIPRWFGFNSNTGFSEAIAFGAVTTGAAELTVRTPTTTTAVSISNGSAATATSNEKHSAVYRVNDFAVSKSGGITSSASGLLPISRTQASIGVLPNGFSYHNGTIRRLVFWPARLPNETLQGITQ